MKKLIIITCLGAGLLLILMPRYILPACEYSGEGHARMHCSDTADAVMIVGAVIAALGAAALAMKGPFVLIADAAIASVLLATAAYLPNVFGYCMSKNMPCHYGMVPGIRFISLLALMILLTSVVILMRESRKRRSS